MPDCLGQESITDVSNRNPCLSERLIGADSVEFTVLTTAASLWHVGANGRPSSRHRMTARLSQPFETGLLVPAPGVLGNDFGDSDMTASLSETPGPGVGRSRCPRQVASPLRLHTGFCGPASFGYTVRSGTDVSNVAVVSLVVNCNPDAGGRHRPSARRQRTDDHSRSWRTTPIRMPSRAATLRVDAVASRKRHRDYSRQQVREI